MKTGVTLLRDETTGLWAAVAVDRFVDGVAAGGIRIKPYADDGAAIADAVALARAMTRKSAMAGVRCGGSKVVVREELLRDRAGALTILGEHVERWGGAIYVGPDFGFTDADRHAVERGTRYMDSPEVAAGMADATARGVRESMAAALGIPPGGTLAGVRAGIQGLGKVGAALARMLRAEGATVVGYDMLPERVKAAEIQAVAEAELFDGALDVLAPCALGGAVDLGRAERLRCRALVGAANHLLAPPEVAVAATLARRGVVHVPDYLANAGALVLWVEAVLRRSPPAERDAAVRRIGDTARAVLARAREEGRTPLEVAEALVDERLAMT